LFLALFGLVRRADLTMREQRRQLVDNETLAAIGEMSSVVAHGIRNPLAAIRSSAELLQDSDSKQARSAAVDIVEQSDRLGAWLRELLSYTRELHGEPTPVPLQPLVQHCLEEFGRQMQASNVAGHTDLPSDLPTVRGDAMLLGQVLRSVLANAIEAMSAGGQIIVRGVSLASSGQVMLSVEDSGPGMTDAELVRAGRPFFTTKPHGLGVGLALARRVMERFGGRLEIEGSRGRGTIVRLYLPTA
ncbi:MAG: ATP-binding protein, partial [Burkholderiaceae bacterium]|nr:ATP-binding protein [Burkholderiaceae bacterium]